MNASKVSTAERLGFDRDARLVIVHADDVGMCQATVTAYQDLATRGLLSSAAVMAPCPWFRAIADFCRDRPDLDIGAHITLTSEWKTYRWGPLSSPEAAAGLIDEEGYLHRTKQSLHAAVEPEAAAREMEAQIARVLEAGLKPSHIDSHMYSAFHSKLFSFYLDAGFRHGLCPVVAASGDRPLEWYDPEAEDAARAAVRQAKARGLPTVDHVVFRDLERGPAGLRQAKAMFDGLAPGLTHLIIHPAVDTPELRAATSQWPSRAAEYEIFMAPELREHVASSDIHVIDYRRLNALIEGA